MIQFNEQQLEAFLTVLAKNENYENLQRLSHEIDCDQIVQPLIIEFEQAKLAFEQAQRFGKYHPDYQAYQRRFAQAKRELDLNPKIQAYKQAHKLVQALLNQMSIALGTAISPNLVVPSDFFTGVVTT
ncbi:MAG: YlbF family regulator, partial [Culicoidibacterales bacterium]